MASGSPSFRSATTLNQCHPQLQLERINCIQENIFKTSSVLSTEGEGSKSPTVIVFNTLNSFHLRGRGMYVRLFLLLLYLKSFLMLMFFSVSFCMIFATAISKSSWVTCTRLSRRAYMPAKIHHNRTNEGILYPNKSLSEIGFNIQIPI